MHILAWLLFIFVLIPCLELICFATLGAKIGIIPTLIIIVGTGLLGASLAHKQGIAAWQRIKDTLKQGRIPSTELLNGLCILIAGIALFVPGFLTDIFGFALMAPPLRALAISALRKHFSIASFLNSIPHRKYDDNDDNDDEYAPEHDTPPDVIDVDATVHKDE